MTIYHWAIDTNPTGELFFSKLLQYAFYNVLEFFWLFHFVYYI